MAKRAISLLKSWFSSRKKPTQSQYHDWLDSFIHKDDGVAIENVSGLQAALDLKTDILQLPSLAALYCWMKEGNTGNTNAHFIGTTDAANLYFKVHGNPAGLLGLWGDLSGLSNTIWTGVAPAGSTTGTVILGEKAAPNLSTNFSSVLIGHGAANRTNNTNGYSHSVVIGMNAGYYGIGDIGGQGNRSVIIGQMSAYRNHKGSSNVFVGAYTGELNNNGHYNTGIGRDSMRSNIDGAYNAALGFFSLLKSSTGIASIPIVSGGAGYTSATVTISAPVGGSPGATVRTATATCTVSGGAVTGIVMTDNGMGYTNDWNTFDFASQGAITVTITGDGTGAVAGTPVLQSSSYNVAVGGAAGVNNEIGQYNAFLGYNAQGRKADSYVTFVGTAAGVDAAVPATTLLTKAVAIGANAKVGASNTMVLGGTGADKVKVVIGQTTGSSQLDITGDAGHSQLRLRTSYTPTGTADANGNTGDVAWDDNYFYVKTSAGWKRTALSTF